jgi:hypothetical protein
MADQPRAPAQPGSQWPTKTRDPALPDPPDPAMPADGIGLVDGRQHPDDLARARRIFKGRSGGR